MPLGVEENTLWGQGSVEIEPGDVLVMYTDGIPDAVDEDGDFYGDKRLVEICRRSLSMSPQEIQAAILSDIQDHVGEADQFDDITLLILSRSI
jgi:sigma-B regulation protein RsbU (phosphoserine phosphatase)